MASKKPVDFLEGFQAEHPDIAADVTELASLYQRKLWHQLTLKIEACFSSAAFNRGDLPVQLFNSFISDFAHKINLLKLAHFAVHAAKYVGSPAQSIELLNGVIARLGDLKGVKVAEPVLFLRMHVAQYKLETDAVADAKTMVEEGREKLETLSGVDPSVSAAVYYVASLYFKGVGNFAEFYRSTLMYLSFVSSDSLPEVCCCRFEIGDSRASQRSALWAKAGHSWLWLQRTPIQNSARHGAFASTLSCVSFALFLQDFKVRLAVDVSLAALLGEHIYSFGQLLQHPIANALDNGPHQWLHEMLKVRPTRTASVTAMATG